MNLKKIIIIILVITCLSSCGPTIYNPQDCNWYNPDKSINERYQDYHDCQAESLKTEKTANSARFIENCMESKGYDYK